MRMYSHKSAKYPAYPSNRHPCHHPGCTKQVRDKRSDGHFFSCCCKHRKPVKNSKKARTDISNPLSLEDRVECVKCGWTGTLGQLALWVDGKPPHRSEHTW